MPGPITGSSEFAIVMLTVAPLPHRASEENWWLCKSSTNHAVVAATCETASSFDRLRMKSIVYTMPRRFRLHAELVEARRTIMQPIQRRHLSGYHGAPR